MTVPTAEDKVALLLSSLSPPVVEAVLSHMTAEQTQRLRALLKSLPSDTPAQHLDDAAKEFVDLFRISERVPQMSFLNTPAPAAETTPSQSEKPVEEEAPEATDPVVAIRAMPAAALTRALRDERPATVALMLQCLEPKGTAEVLRLLPAEIRQEAALRLARPTMPAKEIVMQVAGAVLARCQTTEEPEPSPGDKLMRLADIVRGLGRDDRTAILDRLEKTDPAAAAVIRKELYRFSDVLRIDDRSLQSILSQLDMKTLAAALKDVSDQIKEKVLSNVSKRAREAVTEEMELSGKVPKAKTEEAQGRVITVIQTMDREGKITLDPV